MNWARRLKRVFGIEIEQCVRGGGRLKVIASIEEAELIERILTHRRERGEEPTPTASLERGRLRRRRNFDSAERRRARVFFSRGRWGDVAR